MTDKTMQLGDGRTLSWAEYGAPEGDAVFFFHGLPGSRRLGAALADDASSLGLRLIAPERPGFGQSSFQPGRGFSSWAADVGDLADHLGVERFYVCGISGGGPYTLAAAHGLGSRVRAAGVISGGGDISTDEALEGMHEQNRAIFELAKSGGQDAVADVMRSQLEALTGGDSAGGPSLEEAMAHMPEADREILSRRPDIGEALAKDGLEAMANGVEGTAYEVCLFTQPWDFDVSEITVPVAIWHGDDDRNAPLSHAQALADRIPAAELIVWTGMGHLTSIERGKVILAHLVDIGT